MIEMKRKPTILEEGKKEFILDCKIKNLTEDTIEYYEKSFYYFNNYVKEIYEEKEINLSKDITQELTNKYILYMREGKELKISTINIRIRGRRSILYYFMRKGYIERLTKMHIV